MQIWIFLLLNYTKNDKNFKKTGHWILILISYNSVLQPCSRVHVLHSNVADGMAAQQSCSIEIDYINRQSISFMPEIMLTNSSSRVSRPVSYLVSKFPDPYKNYYQDNSIQIFTRIYSVGRRSCFTELYWRCFTLPIHREKDMSTLPDIISCNLSFISCALQLASCFLFALGIF